MLMILLLMIITTICFPFLISEPNTYTHDKEYLVGDFFDFAMLPMALATLTVLLGFTVNDPKNAIVFILFGEFKGVSNENGFFWVNPFTDCHKVSLKVNNFSGNTTRINDKTGSPVDAAALCSWVVVDPSKYYFNAEDPLEFVTNAIDQVLRNTVSSYPFDIVGKEKDKESEKSQACLRDNSEEIAEEMRQKIQDIVDDIGVKVVSANIGNISYAQEISSIMLQRQQALAMIDARETIVNAAVTMTVKAISDLSEGESVKLGDADKARLAVNLMTVMVGEKGATPIIPLG